MHCENGEIPLLNKAKYVKDNHKNNSVLFIYIYYQQNNRAEEVKDVCSVHSDY